MASIIKHGKYEIQLQQGGVVKIKVDENFIPLEPPVTLDDVDVQELKITNVQVFPMKEGTNLKAFARVLLNDELQLTALRIYEGVNGLFVAYPNDATYSGEDYRQVFYPVTRKLRDAVEKACIEKYEQKLLEEAAPLT